MIVKVLVFRNGMVMVFNECGQQLPEYQGMWDEKRDLILRDKPDCVQIQHGVIWKGN